MDFAWTAIERRFPSAAVESDTAEGWAWYELDDIDTSTGANRAERDALRLIAIVLAHWDNKSANQRLVCSNTNTQAGHWCAHPFAMIHDLGATFGPKKVDLAHWQAAPIWNDATQCTVSMRHLPYNGGTFRTRRSASPGGSC